MAVSNAQRQKAHRERLKEAAGLGSLLTPDLIERVDAWATEQHCTREAALSRLVERGLMRENEAPRSLRKLTTPGVETAGTLVNVHLGPVTRKPGSMLKKGRG